MQFQELTGDNKMQPMRSDLFPPIPSETANAAQFVFSRDNFYLITGEIASGLFSNLLLNEPLEWVVSPERKLARFYLITIFQYIEVFSDLQAHDALRSRVDWKYALHLPLEYRGLETSSLCSFRRWLVADPANLDAMETILFRLADTARVTNKRILELSAVDIVANVCQINRLAIVHGAVSKLLVTLATRQPDLLSRVSSSQWYERYAFRKKNTNLADERSERDRLAQSIGRDGYYLLKLISDSAIAGLEDLPEVSELKRIWQVQYHNVGGELYWNKDACAGCPAPGKLIGDD